MDIDKSIAKDAMTQNPEQGDGGMFAARGEGDRAHRLHPRGAIPRVS